DRVRPAELPRLRTSGIERDGEAQDLPRAGEPRGRRDLLGRDEVHRAELVVVAPPSPVRETLRHFTDVRDRERELLAGHCRPPCRASHAIVGLAGIIPTASLTRDRLPREASGAWPTPRSAPRAPSQRTSRSRSPSWR